MYHVVPINCLILDGANQYSFNLIFRHLKKIENSRKSSDFCDFAQVVKQLDELLMDIQNKISYNEPNESSYIKELKTTPKL